MVQRRLWQVDAARGFAVLLMIFFNYLFALNFLGIYRFEGGWLFWQLFPRAIGSAFIFIAGVSLVLSQRKWKRNFRRRNFSRGLKIFALGVLITLATLLAVPQQAIIFGILHALGLSIILSVFLTKSRWLFPLAVLVLALGFALQFVRFDFYWLQWLGLIPADISTFDYWPLVPWSGFMFLGIWFGQRLFQRRVKKVAIPTMAEPICFLGRHSLHIYLLHQPALLLLLQLLGFPILSAF